jgi:hypothetical protein
VPFAEFLERHARKLKPAVVRMARSMVEGFDAADATRISAREVLDEWSGPAAATDRRFALVRVWRNVTGHATSPDGRACNAALSTVVEVD